MIIHTAKLFAVGQSAAPECHARVVAVSGASGWQQKASLIARSEPPLTNSSGGTSVPDEEDRDC
jgi:hypothetical protein